jgi:hypothetical protein
MFRRSDVTNSAESESRRPPETMQRDIVSTSLDYRLAKAASSINCQEFSVDSPS